MDHSTDPGLETGEQDVNRTNHVRPESRESQRDITTSCDDSSEMKNHRWLKAIKRPVHFVEIRHVERPNAPLICCLSIGIR